MAKKSSRHFLLLSTDRELKEQFLTCLSPFGVTCEETPSEKVTDAILDNKKEKETKSLFLSLREQAPTCRITLITHKPFTPELVETLSATYASSLFLPFPLSQTEVEATVRSFFADPEAPPLVSPELVARYRLNILEKLKELFTALETLREGYAKEQLKILRTEAHKISGSGASYGFAALGDVCRQLDLYLSSLLEKEPPLPPDFFSLCDTLLRQALFGFQKIALSDSSKEKPREEKASTSSWTTPLLYLVSPDPLVQRLFATHASEKGIRMVGEIDPHRALEQLQKKKISPSYLILEREYPVDRLTFEDFLSLFSSEPRPRIGLIIVKRDLASRIGLSSKNLSFFLQKPLTDRDVESALDRFLTEGLPLSIKALILDDDPDAAAVLEEALKARLITTKVLSDETALFSTLEHFSPHLLFLDLGLKTYQGPQILSIIRSDITYQHLIVILYTATRTEKYLTPCRELGIHYILFKPLDKAELEATLRLVTPLLTKQPDYRVDIQTDLLHEEVFGRSVEEICHSSPTQGEFALVFIQIQDFATLKKAYGEETMIPLLRGLHIEAKRYFDHLSLVGKVAEDTLGFLLHKEKADRLSSSFERITQAFFKDIQVYTPVETPLRFHAAALFFSPSPDNTYSLLKKETLHTLEEATQRGENQVAIQKLSPATAPPSMAPSVVLVDDDTYLLELLTEAFKREGFLVTSFSEGQAAIDYFFSLNELPDHLILVLDRLLPDMDGLDLLRKISVRFGKQVRTIFLSGLTSEQDVLKGIQEGAVDYIFKPFNTNILLKKALALLSLG